MTTSNIDLTNSINIKILDDNTISSTVSNNIDINLDNIFKNDTMKKILLNRISDDTKIINDKFFVVSSEYDRLFKKYNLISLSILIISALITFIEAFRLLFIDYLKNNHKINTETFSFIINSGLLIMGTVITVLTSIVRFRNYREILEKLKNSQNSLLKFKLIYDKCKISIDNFYVTNNLNNITYNDFKEKLEEYNREIKDINIQENIRNSQYIKINKYKAKFYYQLDKIKYKFDYKRDLLKNRYDILTKQNKIIHDIALKDIYTISSNVVVV